MKPQKNHKDVAILQVSPIMTKRRVIKNLITVSFGFLFLFSAYNGLSVLQSSINQKQGIGVASQAITYAAFGVSALLLPKYTMKRLGCKNAMLLSMVLYVPYLAATFLFNWFTMVPSAALVGLAAAVLWSAQCTYFNESALIYSSLINNDKYKREVTCEKLQSSHDKSEIERHMKSTQELVLHPHCLEKSSSDRATAENQNNTESSISQTQTSKTKKSFTEIKLDFPDATLSSITARFFGLFGLFYRTSDIWGNLISYYVLLKESSVSNTISSDCICGAYFCNEIAECNEQNLAEPSQELKNVLTGIYVAFGFLGIFIVYRFLEDVGNKKPVKFSLDLAMATCRFAATKAALLLLPFSAYIGFMQSFYIGDYTKAFVSCAWGVYHVGLVTIVYGISAAASSFASGFLVRYIGRIKVILLGEAINVLAITFFLLWNPAADKPAFFFLGAGLWGSAIGILWSQLRGFYGIVFKSEEETAFSCFYLWDSIGYCIGFSYSNYLCTYIKVYILLAVSIVGIFGYLRTEFVFKNDQHTRHF